MTDVRVATRVGITAQKIQESLARIVLELTEAEANVERIKINKYKTIGALEAYKECLLIMKDVHEAQLREKQIAEVTK